MYKYVQFVTSNFNKKHINFEQEVSSTQIILNNNCTDEQAETAYCIDWYIERVYG